MALSINESANYQVKAIATKALKTLKTDIETSKTKSTDSDYTAHLDYALERMKAPEKAKPTVHKEMPPGAPIGCGEE